MEEVRIKRNKKNKKKNSPILLTAILAAVVVFIFLLVFITGHINKNNTGQQVSENIPVHESESSVSDDISTDDNTDNEKGTAGNEETPEIEETTGTCTLEYESGLLDLMVKSTETSVDISGKTVTDFDGFVGQLKMLPAITYIDMCDCGLSNEQMEILMSEFPDIKFVWKVTLGLWTIRTDRTAFSTLKDGTITYRLTNEDVKVLKYCTDMKALDLGHNKVTDLSFLQYMPELRILILVDNWAGETADPYISDISMLRYCPKLKYLEFFVGSVNDISVLSGLKEMVDLNISYNPISDVTPLLGFPKIQRLYLEHTDMTEEDYNLLKQTYPDAQIVYYGEGSVDQGWRTHDRYFSMIDMFHNDYLSELFE